MMQAISRDQISVTSITSFMPAKSGTLINNYSELKPHSPHHTAGYSYVTQTKSKYCDALRSMRCNLDALHNIQCQK
jgi:hypothetical protein